MAVYTQLTQEDLKQVATIFGLPEITSVQDFASGQANSNYHLRTGEQEYVLTLCDYKSAEEAQTLIDTLRHLETHDFSTTRIIPTRDGAMLTEIHGKPLLLKSYLPGRVIDPLPLDTMYPLGQAMARLHQVPVPDFLPVHPAYGRQTYARTQQDFGQPHPFLDWLKMIEKYLQNSLPEDLPRALIHADIFADNIILTTDHDPVIMDFEEARNYYRIYDLGMAIVGTCYPEGTLNSKAREELLQGYESVTPLTEIETRSLIPVTIHAAASMSSWRFWQFNVVQPGEGKQEHYRALQKIANDQLGRALQE